jgi:hypothetical protein
MCWFYTTIQATVFDVNIFCHHISQLTQLTSGNIPHPEHFDQMIYTIGQGEGSLQQIVSTLRENSVSQIFSGIHDPDAIL